MHKHPLLKVLLFSIFCNNLIAQQINIIPCVDHPQVKDDFTTGDNHHAYSYSTTICDNSQNSKCTVEFVYSIMKSNKQFIAPTDDNSSVNNCEQFNVSLTNVAKISSYCTWLDFKANVFNLFKSIDNEPIVTVIDELKHNVTNFTAPGHYLHPGKVTRTVLQEGNLIKVITIGVGTSESAAIAARNSDPDNINCVWGYVDKRLKDEVDAQLLADVEPASAEGLSEKDLLGTWYGSLQKIEYPKSTIQSIQYTIHQYSKDSLLLTRINKANKPADTLFTKVRYTLNRDSGKLIMYLNPRASNDGMLTTLNMDYFIGTDEQPILNCQVSSNVWLNSYKLEEKTNILTKKFNANSNQLFKYFNVVPKDSSIQNTGYSKNPIGGKTPSELGRLLLQALKTNNKNLWLACVHPQADPERAKYVIKAFDEFRSYFEGSGVENWNLIEFSRATFINENTYGMYPPTTKEGEKIVYYFGVEFYYNHREFLGAFSLGGVTTYKKGNWFVHTEGNRSKNFGRVLRR